MHSRYSGPQESLMNLHSLKRLVVVQQDILEVGAEGYSCTDNVKIPGLGGGKGPESILLPTTLCAEFSLFVQLLNLERRLCTNLLPKQDFLLIRN